MRVCIFTSTNDKSEGGPSRSVPILAKGVSKVGCDTFLMTRETIDMNFHALEGFPAVRLKILPYNITYIYGHLVLQILLQLSLMELIFLNTNVGLLRIEMR